MSHDFLMLLYNTVLPSAYSAVRSYRQGSLTLTVCRFSGFTLLFFILFIVFYVWQVFTFAVGVMRLVDMYNFYTYLLKIPNVRTSDTSLVCFILTDAPYTRKTSKPYPGRRLFVA